MKRRILAIVLVLVMVIAIGCGDKKKGSGDATPTPAGGNNAGGDQTADPGDIEATMIEKSLGNRGNNHLFKKFVDKVKSGAQATVVFYGGSTSTDTNAGTEKTFPVLVSNYLKETYGNNIDVIISGIDGCSSTLGLIRSDRDLVDTNADLIFLDFSANDGGGKVDENGFESLLRKTLTLPQEPAVIVLNSVTDEGSTQQDNINNFCFQYGVPTVNVKPAIFAYIDDKNSGYTWQHWSNDKIHPNPDGHALYSKFIINLLKILDEGDTASAQTIPAKPIRGADHVGIKMVDTKNNTNLITIGDAGDFAEKGDHPNFNAGWQKPTTSGEESASFQFRFKGKALYIVYKSASEDTFGTAEVLVDGVVMKEMFGYPENGGGDAPNTIMAFSEKEAGDHKIEIRMREGEETLMFSILAFGVVQ